MAVWVVWWVGMAFVCAFVGDIWALVNPWAAIGRLALRLRGKCRPPRLVLPEQVGVWPAVLLFLVFAWVELVWPSNAVPVRLACAILLYSALTFASMALFGVETWLKRGEVFSLVFSLFGRSAPLTGRRRSRQTVSRRPALGRGAGITFPPVLVDDGARRHRACHG